jgi:hypothetical protein
MSGDFQRWKIKIDSVYENSENLLSDMRSFSLRDDFAMTDDCFTELHALLIGDIEVAELIRKHAVALLMAARNKQEVEALIGAAEVWSGG